MGNMEKERPTEQNESLDSQESLDKIDGLLGEWVGPTQVAKDLYPDIAEKYEELHYKFGEIDQVLSLGALSNYAQNPSLIDNTENITDKGKKILKEMIREYRKSKVALDQEVKDIDRKDIAVRAKEVFSKMDKSQYFERAYEIALRYLDQGTVTKTAEKLLAQKATELISSRDPQEIFEASKKILNSRYAPEASRDKELLKQALNEFLKKTKKRFFYSAYDLLSGAAEQWGLPPNDRLYEFNESAKKDIKSLMISDKGKAAKKADILLNAGFLDLEKDEDLFDELTERR